MAIQSTENIIIRMRGGLGNQLFQLAYGIFLKKQYSAKNLILDISEYHTYHIRSFELNHLNLKQLIIKDGIPSKKYLITRMLYHFCQGVYKKLFQKDLNLYNYLTKWGLFYAGISPGKNSYKNNKRNIYIYGYFQDVNYVDPIKNELYQLFNISNKYHLKHKTEDTEYLAISIRCGIDYKKAGYHICNTDYYENAIKYIRSKRPEISLQVLVFSDDIDQAKKILHIRDMKVHYMGKETAVQQLIMMKECDHFIISNSSFSWWGAYLSKNEDKIVVAPKQWFPSPLINTKDTKLVYKNMVIL